MAVPRVGIINPEALSPAQPRIAQPTPGISTATRTTLPSQTRGTQAAPTAPKTPATLFPLPTGKPATSVSAPGGMISQAPSGTRPPTSTTRGNQTAAAIQARATARAAAVPTSTATPPAATAPAPAPAPAPKPQSTATTSGGGKKKKKYTPPAGYDRLAGYSADASPDQILFEKNQIYARNLARGIEMTAEQVNQRFDERLSRFQQTGEPAKNKDPEDAVAAPTEEVPLEPVISPEQQAMQDQIDQLTSLVQELQDSMSSRTDQQNGQATTPNPTAPSPLETLAQSLAPKPSSGSLANLDQNRIGQMLQVAAPIMFAGTFADVVAAIIAAGITPTAPELAWLEAEVARYRAG